MEEKFESVEFANTVYENALKLIKLNYSHDLVKEYVKAMGNVGANIIKVEGELNAKPTK